MLVYFPQVACTRSASEAWLAVEEQRRAAAEAAAAAAAAVAAEVAMPKSKRRRAPQPWQDLGTEVRLGVLQWLPTDSLSRGGLQRECRVDKGITNISTARHGKLRLESQPSVQQTPVQAVPCHFIRLQ